jgi:hypothetical protein
MSIATISNEDTWTARAVGMLFLAAMAIYLVGNGLAQSVLAASDHPFAVPANGVLLALGASLMLLAAGFDATHGILMLPLLARHSERLAFGYFGFRIINAVLLALGVVLLLLQIPLGRASLNASDADAATMRLMSALSLQAHTSAYETAMIAVGVAGVILCSAFVRMALVPRPVAVWGLVGYAILLGGSAVQLLGIDLQLLHTIPGGLRELFIGVWLIVKGFNAAAHAADRDAPGAVKPAVSRWHRPSSAAVIPPPSFTAQARL